ncbi:glycosyltransferase [Sphingosinicella xenopeptidilytica]|uniref:Glycosyltransferase n=1 Tax=Sphingosinicella xenopeptidilytica TaxID=364098 RepID=A0ABW3C335_SPHXN
MKILYVVNGYPTLKNPQFCCFVKEQVDEVAASGVDFELCNIEGRGILKYLRAIRSIREQAASCDIVHAQHMLCGLATIAAGVRKRLVTSFMSDGAANLRGKSKFLGHLMFHAASALSYRCIYKSRVPKWYEHKSICLPNGVDTERFRPIGKEESCAVLNLDATLRYALFVSAGGVSGPLRAVKRHDLFRKMLSELQSMDSRWTELLITNVGRDMVPYYFGAADVLILTSDVEGSPNAVKEALACGTAVVARDVGDVSSLLDGIPNTMCFTLETWEQARSFLVDLPDYSPDLIRSAFMHKALDKVTVNSRLIAFYEAMLASIKPR